MRGRWKNHVFGPRYQLRAKIVHEVTRDEARKLVPGRDSGDVVEIFNSLKEFGRRASLSEDRAVEHLVRDMNSRRRR